ncbi:MAG: hypothetical protein Fur009_1120 [Candidatus Microgenomates bacterium]
MKNLIYPVFVNLTFLANILILFLFLGLIFLKKKLINFFKKFGLFFIFIISFLAMAGSLSFSEILKWNPCKLCWYQRIFMYPQIIISSVAYFIKDKKGYFYHFWLSLFGFFIALFHYLIQKNIISGIDCNLVSSSTTCLKINFSYGFISIPFMAMISFLLIIIISFLNLYETKKTKD